MNAILAKDARQRGLREEPGERAVPRVEPAGVGAERRQDEALPIGEERAPADGAARSPDFRARMKVPGHFAGPPPRKGLVTKKEGAGEMGRGCPAGKRRLAKKGLVVIADDPDDFEAAAEGGDAAGVCGLQATKGRRVVETVAKKDEQGGLEGLDLGFEPGEGRAGVVGGKELPPRRVARTLLEMQIPRDENAGFWKP